MNHQPSIEAISRPSDDGGPTSIALGVPGGIHHYPSVDGILQASEIERSLAANEPETDVELHAFPPPQPELNYSIFTKNEKRFIVFMASMASFFSPVSSNIFFPALNTLALNLHVSDSLINLTITTYLIFQGIAPTVTGSYSDVAGRRPAYLFCFTIYLGANIGLALQTNYAALLVLRMVQSSGSSGTIALANAVVADIATSAERGTYIGYASAGALLGPAFGPVIGGLLSQFLGWRSIFWFLAIFSGSFFILLLIFFPETCRKVVGNGSVPPPNWAGMSLLNYYHLHQQKKANPERDFAAERRELASKRPSGIPNPFAALKIIFEKEAAILLVFNGLMYAGFYQVTTGIPSQFKLIYGFNDLQVGLCFIPLGIGSSFAAVTQGWITDWNYKRHAIRHGFPVTKTRQQDLGKFPIETARLQVILPMLYLGIAAVIAFGWVLKFQTNLAGPLVLLFVIGYAVSTSFNVISTLMIDIYPDNPATATAANNLVRCELGAGATAILIPMINRIGRGWTYTFVGLVWLIFSPSLFVLMKWGPQWRVERLARIQRKKEEEENARRDVTTENGLAAEAGAEDKLS
ncbi:MAG: hypothetical protein MMC33_005485 [Icmadophila ericetorum]|nr:hypothetical protein [Icmadophila ericetorum]